MNTAPPIAPVATIQADFDTAVTELAAKVRGFIRRRVRDDATADDLAQETLLKVYRSRAALRDGQRIEAWLYRIARTTLIDFYRRQRPGEELPADLAEETDGNADEVTAAMVRSLRRFLEELPERYREPVRLAEFEGLPLAKIALRMGLSLTAVKSRVRRAGRCSGKNCRIVADWNLTASGKSSAMSGEVSRPATADPPSSMPETKPTVLILCTGNSCRSHLAEGILRSVAGDLFDVQSAGSKPAGHVHPLAIRAMAEIGTDISAHRSKHMNDFLERPIETVITVCGNADQACPIYPGQVNRHHWPFEDPAHATGTDEEKMAVFRRVREEIRAVFSAYADGRRDALKK